MQFNSYEFILLLFPMTVILYFLSNKIKPVLGKIVLILASIVFYSLGRWEMLIFLAVSMAVNFLSACLLKRFCFKSRFMLVIPIVINVGFLLWFKYLNFVISNVNMFFGSSFPLKNMILPLGISFYTFQQIAYIVSVGRGEIDKVSLLDYLVYILFFPKLVMGPIVDPVDFIAQINDNSRKKVNTTNLAVGAKLFSLGLMKKVMLADTFARGANWIYDNLPSATAADCILLIIFYTFEIYFDFSGYSDMAVGISSMINIDLPMNFNSPYKAVSIRDFWKRWHISLTKFLTKYIYIPLGGSRKGTAFTYINTMIVFLISGLWHGANWTFILWGLLHGLLSCFDRAFEKAEDKVFKPVRWLLTMIWVSVLWLLFSADSVTQWLMILKRAASIRSLSISDGLIDTFKIVERTLIYDALHLAPLSNSIRGFIMLVFMLIAAVVCLIPQNNFRNKEKFGVFSMIGASVCFVWGVLCLGSESVFVYFGF